MRSEPLCFIQNNVSSTTRMNLVTWLSSFYSAEELTEANSALFSVAESLKLAGQKLNGMPRNVARRSGDGRRKADSEDILDLWSFLDTAKAPLPTFVAVNLKRMPDIPVADTDLCALTVNVLSVKNQLDDIMFKMVVFADLRARSSTSRCS